MEQYLLDAYESLNCALVAPIAIAVIWLWVVIAVYAGKLRSEVRQAASLSKLVLKVMEINGMTSLRYDEKGEIVGASVKSGRCSE